MVLDVEDNEDALEFGFTMIVYGAIIGMGSLLILFGSYKFIGFLDAGQISFIPFIVIGVLTGWMIVILGIGGALRDSFMDGTTA